MRSEEEEEAKDECTLLRQLKSFFPEQQIDPFYRFAPCAVYEYFCAP